MSYLFGIDILHIEDNTIPKTTFGFSYFKQSDENLSAKDILNDSSLKKVKKLNLGILDKPVWTKFTIKNNTQKIQKFVLFNERAGINYIDVYIYKDKKLIKKHILGDMNSQVLREFISRYSAFFLDLDSNETLEVITKVENYGVYNIGWYIHGFIDFFEDEQTILFLFSFLGGFLFFYILFNIAFYLISKEISYLILSLWVLFILIYTYSVNGYFYSFDIGIPLQIISDMQWISPIVSTIFLILFPYIFFDLKNKYPKIVKIILLIIVIYIFIFISTYYMIYVDNSLFIWYKIYSIFYFITPIIMLSISFYFMLKREEFGEYYFFGQLILTLFNIFHTLEILGFVHISVYNPIILPFAITIDALFLFLIVYKKSKQILSLQQNQKDILMEQLRYISIGQAIGGMVHQWKIPLTYIGNIVTILETTLKFNKDNLQKELEKYLPELSLNIDYMSHTSEELLGQYSSKSRVKLFYPKSTIEEYILKVLSSKITLKNAKIEYQIDENIVFNMDENIFINILIILIDNSLDIMDINKDILIKIIENKNNYIIKYNDRCGGIKEKPIYKIFDYQYSTKSDGHGIGLAILKMLITDKLHGNIYVENKNDGALFTIIVPKI